MDRTRRGMGFGRIVLVVLAGWVASSGSRADDPPKPPDVDPAVRSSQMACSTERDGRRAQFRASVIAKAEGSITLLTAGHCLGPADVGGAIALRRNDQTIVGRVETVWRNPFYRPAPSGDIPGADNACARVTLDTRNELIAGSSAAEVIVDALPDPSGRVVLVQMVDQLGRGHVVRAGNFTNPRWLEWGPAYSPKPGDSGSGVFVSRQGHDGKVTPHLVGVVVDRSERGGGASLLSLRDRWVRTALEPAPPSIK